MTGILQSARSMHLTRNIAALLLSFQAALFAQQTNAPASTAPASTVLQLPAARNATNAPIIVPAGLTNATLRPVSLEEMIQLAIAHNFDVQIRRYDPEISKYILAGSYSVYEPALGLSGAHSVRSNPGGFDPVTGLTIPSVISRSDEFGATVGQGLGGYVPSGGTYSFNTYVNHNEQSDGSRGSEQYNSGWSLSFDQPLLRNFWIDAQRATIQINKKNLKSSEWQLRGQIISTIAAVEAAYYDLIFYRENVQVQRTALELANQLLRENKKRVEVGALAPLDEKQAESQVAASVAALIEAEQNYAIQQNTLKNLITDDFSKMVDVTLNPVENLVAVPADADLAESWKRGLTMRPEIQQKKLELETRDINLKYLKNQIWPALDLVASYGENDRAGTYGTAVRDLLHDDNPAYRYGVIMSIPLGGIKSRNSYKQTFAQKQQALLQYKQLEQTVMVQIDNAVKLLRSQFQKVEATRQARLFAQDALTAEQKKLESGKSTSFLVLQAQRDLTQRKYEEIQALANYNVALSGLAQQEGATLIRHNLSVNIQ